MVQHLPLFLGRLRCSASKSNHLPPSEPPLGRQLQHLLDTPLLPSSMPRLCGRQLTIKIGFQGRNQLLSRIPTAPHDSHATWDRPYLGVYLGVSKAALSCSCVSEQTLKNAFTSSSTFRRQGTYATKPNLSKPNGHQA